MVYRSALVYLVGSLESEMLDYVLYFGINVLLLKLLFVFIRCFSLRTQRQYTVHGSLHPPNCPHLLSQIYLTKIELELMAGLTYSKPLCDFLNLCDI